MQEGRNAAGGEAGETKSHHNEEECEVCDIPFQLPAFFYSLGSILFIFVPFICSFIYSLKSSIIPSMCLYFSSSCNFLGSSFVDLLPS
jgi:hypothetical protein